MASRRSSGVLHSEDRDPPPEPRQARKLCRDFPVFFNEKLTRIAVSSYIMIVLSTIINQFLIGN